MTDYIAGNSNELTFIYDEGNNGRLPTYHRLDINMKKTFSWESNEHLKLELIAGMTNVATLETTFSM